MLRETLYILAEHRTVALLASSSAAIGWGLYLLARAAGAL